jgi:AcrR family transcriptional regulator
MSQDKTKYKILLTAESLFADQGYASTSIRQIVQKADVNIAAVHYHFGSKQSLFLEVIRNRFEPLESARLAMLASSRENGLDLESVIRSFIKPVFDIRYNDQSNANFLKLMNYRFFTIADTDQRKAYEHYMKVTRDAFVDAFKEVLTDSSLEDIYWHFHLMITMLTSLSSNEKRLELISEGTIKSTPPDDLCNKIITYMTHSIEQGSNQEHYFETNH